MLHNKSYNQVNQTCITTGQIIKTAPHVYVKAQDFFAAVGDIVINGGANGGSGVAVATQPQLLSDA